MPDIRASRRPALEPIHPGTLLRDTVLPAAGLSVTEAAAKLKMPQQALEDVLAGRASVTPEMAGQLGKLFGNGTGLWLGMQQNRDLWHVQREQLRKRP